MPDLPHRLMSPKILLLLIFLLISACNSGSSDSLVEMKFYPLDKMPADIQAAPAAVQQAYQYAVANSEIMTHIPCYCGCGAMGHTSNYACYASGQASDGSVIFDTHALGCSICVDITLDTMRLVEEGQSVAEIKGYIDQTYSQYGPSNMP